MTLQTAKLSDWGVFWWWGTSDAYIAMVIVGCPAGEDVAGLLDQPISTSFGRRLLRHSPRGYAAARGEIQLAFCTKRFI